jgi:hypothetical protein
MGHSASPASLARNIAPAGPTPGDTPVLLVIEERPGLADSIAELCAFLNIRVIATAPGVALAVALRKTAPIAVLAESDIDGLRLCNTLKTIASYDPALPILVLTDANPAILGTLDGAEYLWSLTNVIRVTGAQYPRAVMEFLAAAGRRCDGARLIAV